MPAVEPGIDLIGAGGHASVVADVARRAGRIPVRIWFERRPTEGRFLPDTGFGSIDDLDPTTPAILAIGDLAKRRGWAQRFRRRAPALVDPSAVIGHGVRLGLGVVVMPGVVVNANARIDRDAILNTGCIVEHDCVVGANTHIAPGVRLGGAAKVGRDTLVGTGAVLLPGVRVGARVTVGAGAVVIGNIEADTTVVGAPARPICR